MKLVQKIIVFVVLCAVFVSCSTKKNTSTTRAYHKFVGHYNTYFNGYESYKEGVKKAESTYPESFDELLPVFSFSYNETANKVTSDMDRAITKSEKMILEHSITAKPELPRGKKMNNEQRAFYNKKEFNEKTPMAHMLIAKAQIYTQNHIGAAATLEYMDSQYAKDTVLYESRIWQAIVSTERNDLEDAENKLREISKVRNYPKQHHQLYHSAWANLLIKQNKYTEAIERLHKAMEFTKKKPVKVRYNFLLAQLYQQTGNKESSLNYFTKVSKMNAPYSVRFASQIQKANSFDPATQGNELKTLYNKMLKDKKNEEYLDQIYYALGNFERLSNNEKLAINHYQKSIEKNIDNNIQLGLTQKALADLYFTKPDYVKSFNNYKSARMSFPQTHQAYSDVMTKLDMLEVLGPNLAIVEREDSLQNIAKMSQTERDRMIDGLIAEVLKQKEEERKAEQSRRYYVQQSDMERYGLRDNAALQSSSSANAKWYFYNTAQLNQGLTEFNMRWGRRKLEDNWRRKNKGAFESESFAAFENEQDGELGNMMENEQDNNTPKTPDLSPDQKQYYLKDLPLTPETMQASNDKIMHALYLAAGAYKNDIKDNKQAINSFEELVRRFPDCEYTVSAYYNLFNLYTETGDISNANKYKNLMSANYPDNILTLATLNPEYLKELERKEKNTENAYTQALSLYRENKNTEALAIINSVIAENRNSDIIARLELLKVLATNYENNLVAYKDALNHIATTYKGTETEKTANEMLAILQQNEIKILSDQTISDVAEATPTQGVEYLPSDKEQYIAVIIDKALDENIVAFEIILFNADYYLDKDYMTNSESFDNKHNIIWIQTIDSKKDADAYYKELLLKSGLLKKLENSEFVHFIISPENLAKLKQSKNVAEYINFFKANY